jgi:hypothetical protein
MSRWLLTSILFLGGCPGNDGFYVDASTSRSQNASDPDASSGPPADAAIYESCNDEGQIGCPLGWHQEVQCDLPGERGCTAHCHCGCSPDQSCSTIDCGPTAACTVNAEIECNGMAFVGQQSCTQIVSPPACEQISDEATCLAQSGCNPLYFGHQCTCNFADCNCADDHGAFARCETYVPAPLPQ